MIVSRTPLRISLAGGGTDLPAAYQQEPGRVVGTSIDRYVYVTVKPRFDDLIHVSYSKKETCLSRDAIQHDLVREAMRMTGVKRGIEIAIMADVPSEGSGLGSSSSLTVGLLNALRHYTGEADACSTAACVSPYRLAEDACKIEIEILGRPIGKQDQFLAAYGGFLHMLFTKRDVWVERLAIEEDLRLRISECLMLFYTGISRQASPILALQSAAIARGETGGSMAYLAQQAAEIKDVLTGTRRAFIPDALGEMLSRTWKVKKSCEASITTPEIDALYDQAIAAGAKGGKISGAGGGGFLLLACTRDKQEAVRAALAGLRELHFSTETGGSQIIFREKR